MLSISRGARQRNQKMAKCADAIVVGAGIVGAACARALAQRGLRVTVIELSVVGGGATAAGMGHIVVLDDSEAQFALSHYSRRLWDELAPQLPKAAERVACGTLWVAADEEELNAARDKCALYRARGASADVLDARQVADAEPNLRPGLAGGLLVSEDSVIYPPCAAAWLLDDASRLGASVLVGKRVAALTGQSVTLEDGTSLQTGLCVNAAGAWAGSLTPALPIRWKKGHLVITDRYPDFCRRQLVELGYLKSAHGHASESVAFNLQPRATGQLLIGSSRQFDVTDAGVEPRMVRRMLSRAAEFVPRLLELNAIRTWTGFRAATPDGLPLIGPHTDVAGLWIAAGHEGLGITTSMGTAELLADLVTGREPAIHAAPYAPERFARAA